MFCGYCGQQLPDEARFCKNCGASLVRAQEAIVHTPKLKLNAGDEISFGTDPNGQRLIWKVIQTDENRAFVLSVKKLCKMPYHQTGGDVTWNDCTLRKWLNNEFLNGYFSETERARIILCRINNDDNPDFATPGGVMTNDKVFLFSINEAKYIYPYDESTYDISWWSTDKPGFDPEDFWLRSPGSKPSFAAYCGGFTCRNGMFGGGLVYNAGAEVYGSLWVRPAMWIMME